MIWNSATPDSDTLKCNLCGTSSSSKIDVPKHNLVIRFLMVFSSRVAARLAESRQAFVDWIRVQEIRGELEAIEQERRPYGSCVPISVNSDTLPRRDELNREISVIESRTLIRKAHRLAVKVEFKDSTWEVGLQGYRLTQDEFKRVRGLIRIEQREQLKTALLTWAQMLALIGTFLAILAYRSRR